MLGIANYEPSFYRCPEEIRDEIGQELSSLIGRRISEIWIVWDRKGNEWFKDCPVIIDIDGTQIELCASKLEEFAITFNKIDMSEKIDWYGIDDFDLEWRKDALSEVLYLKNKLIKGIELIEYNFQTELVFSNDTPNSVGAKNSTWVLNGVGFELEGGYFSIYNGLDENAISISLDDSKDLRKTKLE